MHSGNVVLYDRAPNPCGFNKKTTKWKVVNEKEKVGSLCMYKRYVDIQVEEEKDVFKITCVRFAQDWLCGAQEIPHTSL